MTNDLKSLQVRKTKLEREIKELEREKNEVCQRLNEKKKQLSNVNSGIKQLQSNVVITEHILVRYLERVKGIDMEEIKKEILDDELKKQILTLGSGKFHRNGFRLIVKNNSILTVEKEEEC